LIVTGHYLKSLFRDVQALLGKNIEEISVHAGAAENTNRTFVLFGVVAGVFQCLPRALQKESMLWIHHLHLSRVKPEEASIKQIRTIKYGAGLYILRVTQYGRIDAGRTQLFGREK